MSFYNETGSVRGHEGRMANLVRGGLMGMAIFALATSMPAPRVEAQASSDPSPGISDGMGGWVIGSDSIESNGPGNPRIRRGGGGTPSSKVEIDENGCVTVTGRGARMCAEDGQRHDRSGPGGSGGPGGPMFSPDH